MYLGRERLGTRKNPEPPIKDMNYSDEDKAKIEEMVNRIKNDYPEFNDLQARIWEIVSRYRGDAGLSAWAVSRMSSYIYEIVK